MKKIRIIARLDVKNEYVIKGIHMEGLRKIGNPVELAQKYYKEGIDEIIFMDAVASLYDRNNLFNIIEEACKNVFVPITIGGGIRSIEDISFALKSGADKVAINTQAIKKPEFITEASTLFGSQCIIGSIEAKKNGSNWEAYTDNGRESTGIDAVEWAKKLEKLGIGELMITSIDNEGTKKGFDMDLLKQMADNIRVPIIACGGAGNATHIADVAKLNGIDAIAIASILHYNLAPISEIKQALLKL